MPTDLVTLPPVSAHRGPVAALGPAPCLHCDPPLTPAGFFAGRTKLLVGLAALFVALALAALVDGGSLLLRWDEPIQRFVERSRTGVANEVFRRISFLGSTKVVLALGAMLSVAAWRRCRAAGIVVVVAMLSRPLLEFTLKAGVDRDRPDLERLVPGNGPSFPSGHVMAAVALWGVVPLVITLYTRRRAVWWTVLCASMVLIMAIGASRTYLGVHWFSDVVGGLIVGTFFLLGAEWLLTKCHQRHSCGHACNHGSSELRLS